VHQLKLAGLMAALQLPGESPGEVVAPGVQPMSTDWCAGLTPALENTLASPVDSVIP
jgi:hypothetical protein